MVIKIAKMDEYTLRQKKKPTNAQWQAIALTGCDVLVSAAAGSGKTEVLSERIVRRVVQDRWNINEMLVLSFTTSASRNMLDRVEKKLTDRLADSDWEYLKMQRLLMGEAQITTIDSFCLNVLKKFYYLVEEEILGEKKYLSSTFKVLADNSQIKTEAVNDVIEEFAEKGQPIISMLFNIFGKKDDVASFLENLYNKIVTFPNYKQYIKKELTKNIRLTIPKIDIKKINNKIYNLDYDDFEFESWKLFNFLQYLKREIRDIGSQDEILKELISTSRLTKNQKYKSLKLIDDINVEELFTHKLYTLEFIKDLEFEFDLFEVVEKFSKIENSIDYYYTLIYFINGLEEILLAIDDHFIAKKRSGDFLDFADLNHLAIKALEKEVDGVKVNTEASKYYKNLFKEIYVDEYQDNNDLQEYILNLIRGENSNFFRVGDVKQAIYGFRGSNPNLFEEKYVSYKKITDYIEDENYCVNKNFEFDAEPFGVCVVLKENFRSYENVLHTSNVVFNRLMHRGNAGITYDRDSALYYPTVKPKKDGSLPTYIIKHEDTTTIMYNIVNEINNIIAQNNEVKYSDFALLFRNANKMLEYKKYFEDCGIPVYLKEKQGFTESFSFNLLFNLIKFLDNRYLDSSLVVLLRSNIFDFSNNDLLELSFVDGESYYDKLLNSESIKAINAKNIIQHWLNISLNKSVAGTVKQISYEIGLEELLVTLPNYESEFDYFDNFIDVLQTCSEQNINISYAVKTLSNIKNKGVFDTKRMSASDSVTLSTIHMSKGLEYDYVFLVELDQLFNKKDYTGKLLFSPELGLTVDSSIFLGESGQVGYNLLNNINSELIRKKMLEEETRNLYVAMTRAVKGLYLVMNKPIVNEELENINCREQVVGRFSECTSFSAMLALVFSFFNENENDDTEKNANIQNYNLIEIPESSKENNDNHFEVFNEKLEELEKIEFLADSISHGSIYPSKTSYSSLKKIKELQSVDENQNVEKHEILNLQTLRKNNSKKNPLLMGNLIHKLFEKIIKDKLSGKEILDLDLYLQSLIKTEDTIGNVIHKKILNHDEYKMINNNKDKKCIRQFVESDIFKIINKGKNIFTEISFTSAESTNKLFKANDNNLVILQGVVDLLVELDDDTFVIVDYKTDNVLKNNGAQILKERHSEQLNIYGEAVKKYFGEQCKVKKYLYSYVLGELIEI